MIQATEEEWNRWHKVAINKALLNPAGYQKWRDGKILFAKTQIERYSRTRPDMLPACQSILDYVEYETPPAPPIPPSEPAGLEPIVYYRLEALKDLCEKSEIAGRHIENINAVISAYRVGKLKVEEGTVSYWYNGYMKIAPTHEAIDLEEELPKWEKEHGTGRQWMEYVKPPYPQLAS